MTMHPPLHTAAAPHAPAERMPWPLDTAPDPAFDAIVGLACRTTACPVGFVSLIDPMHAWFKARAGWPHISSTRAVSPCRHALAAGRMVVVADTLDGALTPPPAAALDAGMRFVAAIPLRLDGAIVGALCVLDTQPHLGDPDSLAARVAALATLATLLDRLLSARPVATPSLRQLEERWALVAEAAGIGAVRLDLASQHMLLDPQACRNLGLEHPQPAYTLDDWLLQIEPADRASASDGVQHALHGRTAFEAQLRFRWPDGRLRRLEIVARAQYDDSGAPHAMVGICRDITAQHEADRLQREKEAAERANRAKGELLSRVSHELRTPLNGILGYAQLMAIDHQHPLPLEQRRRLDGVRRAGEHLLRLVGDVLDLTHVDRDEHAPALAAVETGKLIDGCIALVAPWADQAGIRLARMPQPSLRVRADARALEQVLMHLLGHAIRHSPRGASVRIECSAAGSRGCITITDDGPGLDAEATRQLFQPFGRVGGRHRPECDAGLGPAIAHRLVLSMNGDLGVSSAPGKGSRFSIALPWAERDDPSAPGALLSMPMTLHDTDGCRVLYIEDEPVNVLLMEEVFRAQSGWMLLVSRDGATGVRRACEADPDVLLVDMNLPDMSGLEVIAHLRADPRTSQLLCIALSADATPEQISAARGAGFDDYWTKPIDVRNLLARLSSAMRSRRAAA